MKMVKTFAALALAAVLLLSLAACGKTVQGPKKEETEKTAETAEAPVVGGWERAEDPTVTDEVRTLMEKATAGLAGAAYTPIAYLASQVVAGRNLAILCRTAPVIPDAEETYAVVSRWEDAEGNVQMTEVRKMDTEAAINGLAGGWYEPESPALTDELKAVFDKAMEGFAGVGYVPVAMVAQQVVAGMNYRFLCEATTVLPGAETDYALVTVYKDLNGNAEITEIVRMDETETDG